MLAEHQFPVTITHAHQVAVIAEIVELITSTLFGFPGEVIELVKAIQMDFEVFATNVSTLQQAFLDIGVASCGK
ncbi:hypothetical protein D3C86_1786480 [compost metagenome]